MQLSSPAQQRWKPMKVGRRLRTAVSAVAAWLARFYCTFATSRVASLLAAGGTVRTTGVVTLDTSS